ncbi:MAG: alpha/beta hydrolase [Candidatus Thorarchaeota archaeon]
MSNENIDVMQGAGPFYFKGNRIGILMIHGGGGGTSADLKDIAEDLHLKEGYTVNVPLLPGFGTTPKELKNIQLSDWKIFLSREISIMKDKCDKIIVGGHSMGGVLALILAANYNLDAVFTISAPIGIRNILILFVPFFKIFVKYHSIETEQFKKDTNGKWVGYNKIPSNIATKLKKLIKEMKKSLKDIICPAIILQGCLDSEIKRKSIDYIFNNIKSERKRKVWLENNSHPILNSPDHDQIVLELIKFINENCP